MKAISVISLALIVSFQLLLSAEKARPVTKRILEITSEHAVSLNWSVQEGKGIVDIALPSVKDNTPMPAPPSIQVWLLKADGNSAPPSLKPVSGVGASNAGWTTLHIVYSFSPDSIASAVALAVKIEDDFYVAPLLPKRSADQASTDQPATAVNTEGDDSPVITIDNRPAAGIPLEASSQQRPKSPSLDGLGTFRSVIDGTIKAVRMRYFNNETWATEKEAKDYLSNLLTHESLRVYDFEIWSLSPPGVPEIECIIEFGEEHLAELNERGIKGHREGRLLIWHTEACFRDATGTWNFVTAFDHFHRFHPKGNRELAEKPKRIQAEQDGAVQPATDVDSKAEGSKKPKSESEGRP